MKSKLGQLLPHLKGLSNGLEALSLRDMAGFFGICHTPTLQELWTQEKYLSLKSQKNFRDPQIDKSEGVCLSSVVGKYTNFVPTLWGIFTLWGRHCGEVKKAPHKVGQHHQNSPQRWIQERKTIFPTALIRNLLVKSYAVGHLLF